MLTVTVEHAGEIAILRCLGRIVRGDETALLCPAMRQEGRKVIVDLTEVDAIDAAGIGALVSLQAAGIYLKLVNPAPQVRQTLKLTKLDSIFEISKSQLPAETIPPRRAGADFTNGEMMVGLCSGDLSSERE